VSLERLLPDAGIDGGVAGVLQLLRSGVAGCLQHLEATGLVSTDRGDRGDNRRAFAIHRAG